MDLFFFVARKGNKVRKAGTRGRIEGRGACSRYTVKIEERAFVIRDDRWEKFITSDKSFQQTDQLTCTVLTVQIILPSRNVAGKILAARNHEAWTIAQMRESLDASRWNYTNKPTFNFINLCLYRLCNVTWRYRYAIAPSNCNKAANFMNRDNSGWQRYKRFSLSHLSALKRRNIDDITGKI